MQDIANAECNLCITGRELLPVVHFVSQIKHFLWEYNFFVRTDNSAMRYSMRIHSDSYDLQGQKPDGW